MELVTKIRRRLGLGPEYDPTQTPPPGYQPDRAKVVLGEAFRRVFEFANCPELRSGHILEFGTYKGYTARLFAEMIREFGFESRLFLFDSFEGLPAISSEVDQNSYEVAYNKVWFKGQMALPDGIEIQIRKQLGKIIPSDRIEINKGYFSETVPKFLPRSGKAAILHIDADLYESALHVLSQIFENDLIQDGTVILFDDYNCNRANPNQGERRAFREVMERFGHRWTSSEFFSYGWHGQSFFIHSKT